MRLFSLLCCVMLVSCQTYDFERVVPNTFSARTEKTIVARKRLKRNMMLLVDNSRSMLSPTNEEDPDCTVRTMSGVMALCGSGSDPCPATCPTRVSEMKNALGGFLQTSGALARLGLTVFPVPGGELNGVPGCDASSQVAIHFPPASETDDGTDSALTLKALEIDAIIQGLRPQGGTPTAGSLGFVGTYRGLTDESDYRDDLVLLLTDGLPNCNGSNANASCSAPVSACECTTASGSRVCPGNDPERSHCSKGCLDRAGTVQAVKALRQKGIRTIVVGFGDDLATGNGPSVLNAIALEGGFPRKCAGGPCATAFFQAGNGAELSGALDEIRIDLEPRPCEFLLPSKPSDPSYLAVLVDEQSLASGPDTWVYDFEADKVTFLGGVCERIAASSPQRPVVVEFRIVERF